ncbi:MAG: hypothetical protein O2819_06460 [Planctomycetota bacterium]|nr:hypothetical protein [Planctomycetota bacterium]MDA1105244.1 hypothetical protein [Planctomycetota bacterium]
MKYLRDMHLAIRYRGRLILAAWIMVMPPIVDSWCGGAQESAPQVPDADQSKVDGVLSDDLTSPSALRTRIESLGFDIDLPAGTRLIRDAVVNRPGFTILDEGTPPRFSIRIDPMAVDRLISTPMEQVDQHVSLAAGADGAWTVIRRDPLTVDGVDAAVLWTTRTLKDGTVGVMGWGVVQFGPSSFVVFTATTIGAQMPATERALDGLLKSFRFVDAKELRETSGRRLVAGERLLVMIASQHRLESVADHRVHWYRLWTLDRNGKQGEIGYLRTESMVAPRSAVGISASGDRAGTRTGLLVHLQSRTLLSPDGKAVSDTDAKYWVALDRSEELWSIVVTDRAGGKLKSWGQSGVRPRVTSGEPFPSLVVSDSDSRTTAGDSHQWTPPVERYLTQAESLQLGRVLMAMESADGDATWFCFDPRLKAVPLRRDSWTKSAAGWEVRTQAFIDAPPTVSRYGPDGHLLRREEPGGVVTEATTLEALVARWRSLGLPTGGTTP